MNLLKTIFGAFWEFVEALGLAGVIVIVSYVFLFQANKVKGQSMEPTYHDGEQIFTDKISYHFNQPKRGDVVVFRSPVNINDDYIKRIIGLPGEQIKINSGHVFINSQLLNEIEYLDSSVYTGPESFLRENQEVTIPEGTYFVMGDNRQHSRDSRDFGPVVPKEFVGKVFFRYWPTNRFGKIDRPSYPN